MSSSSGKKPTKKIDEDDEDEKSKKPVSALDSIDIALLKSYVSQFVSGSCSFSTVAIVRKFGRVF